MIAFFDTEPIARLMAYVPEAKALSADNLPSLDLPAGTQVFFCPDWLDHADIHLPKSCLLGINEVINPNLDKLPSNAFYYNGWPAPPPGKTLAVEVVAHPKTFDQLRSALEPSGLEILAAPATPGMLSARVIAMIINEAHLLLREGAATAEDIDLSMRLGTGYPLGPFAWEQLWGHKKAQALLAAMAEREPELFR